MKKILITALIVLAVFLIYLGLQDKKVYYVSIGDDIGKGLLNDGTFYGYSEYINEYLIDKNIEERYVNLSQVDYRITDIIKDIDTNKVYYKKNIKNILIKADLLTLSVGYNDLISKLNKYNNNDLYNYIISYFEDLDKLFDLIRKYSKEDIIMIGYYNIYKDQSYDSLIKYINETTKNLAEKYDIKYIDIEDVEIGEMYPTDKGYRQIFDKVRRIIDEEILD